MARQPKKTEAGYQKGENRGGKVVATYLYQDENGKDYHLIEKTEHKQYPQKHWGIVDDDTGKTGWLPGAPKVKIPYQLPELLAAIKAGEPVFVCEGEKDADTVTKMGLCATTNSAGAGKWHTELNKWFKGCKVAYVLEDNDEDGYDHADMVAQALVGVGVAKVCKIHFDELPEKSDVTDWVKEFDGSKEKLLEKAASAISYKKLPVVMIEGSNLPYTSKQLENALVASKQPVLSRGGQLVQPIYQHWRNIVNGKLRVTQTTQLHTIDEIGLHAIARKHACRFYKYDGRAKKNIPCAPPSTLLAMTLSEAKHGPYPKVKGCINAPTLRPDGTILSEPGFDDMTGLWHYQHDAAVLPKDMPKKPTKADAMAALKILKNIFKEVAFAQDIDQTVALAAVLTAVARGAFNHAPMFLFAAPTPGTGKSYLVDIISHITQGASCDVVDLSGPKEERTKRMDACLLSGTTMVSLDNLTQDLDDVVINIMLTQQFVSVRVLGESKNIKCEWRGSLFATGNHVQLVGDLNRRGLTCNLIRRMAAPETKRFAFNPIEEILGNRGKYLAAVLTIVRAYVLDKGKKVESPLIGFEGWSRFVKDPLIWLGEGDVLVSQTVAKRADPQERAAQEFIELWIKGDFGIKKEVAYRATDIIAAANGMTKSDLNDLLLLHCGAPGGRPVISAKRLGWWLHNMSDRVVAVGDGWVVTPSKATGFGNKWQLMPASEWTKTDK